MGIEVAGADRLLVTRVADDDVSEALFQVFDGRGQAEDRHDFGGHHDVEPVLARVAVGRPAQRHGDFAQCAIVHVEDALPLDAPHVDAQFVAVVDVVVDQRGEEVVGELDRAEVPREMQVDVLHRDDLGIASASRAALHPEHGTERRLAQADHRLLANVVECIAKADRSGGLALTSRSRADRRDQDQLAVLAVLERIQVLERNLGLGVPVGLEVLLGNAEFFERHLVDALHRGCLGDFDIRRHGGSLLSLVLGWMRGTIGARPPPHP